MESVRSWFVKTLPKIIRSSKAEAFGAPNDNEIYTQCYYANRDTIKKSLERFLEDVDNHPVELVEWCENRWLEIMEELADKIEALGRPCGHIDEWQNEFEKTMAAFVKWLWYM